jgi:hypothetical protein
LHLHLTSGIDNPHSSARESKGVNKAMLRVS